jgi:hypothetical protein
MSPRPYLFFAVVVAAVAISILVFTAESTQAVKPRVCGSSWGYPKLQWYCPEDGEIIAQEMNKPTFALIHKVRI